MRDFDWNKAVDKRFEDKRRNLLETLERLVGLVMNERTGDIPGGEGVFDDKDFSIPLPKRTTLRTFPAQHLKISLLTLMLS
jgi:hypothetical protein